VYKFLRTDEAEMQKVNEAFFEAYIYNASSMEKFPPIGMIDRTQYYQSAILRFMKLLDKEYKKYAVKQNQSVSSPDGS
jgi:hypothetical protein